MKFTALITAGLLSASALAKQAAYKYERLDKNDAVSCLSENHELAILILLGPPRC
jgi:hypothetical protein